MAKRKKKFVQKPVVQAPVKEHISEREPLPASTVTRIRTAIIFVFAFLLYANTLSFDYNLDDGLMITENNFTKKGFSGISDIMTNDAFVGFFGENKNLLPGGRYRPLSQVWFAVEYEFFGLDPFVGHLVNVLFYALVCAMIFLFLRKMLQKYDDSRWYMSIPFVATMLFVAHPLHTEAVANIKGRDEIMCLLGAFGTLWLTVRWMQSKKIWYIPLIVIAFVLAILSKENAITFFAVIPLTLYVFYKQNIAKSLLYSLPLVAAVLIYFFIRYEALGFLTNDVKVTELLNDPYLNAKPNEQYATVFYTWGIYIKLLFYPHPLTHDYYPKHIPLINWGDFRALGSFLLYLLLTVFAVWKIWKRNIIAYGILFFLLTFSIQSNLFFNIGAFMNERFVFLSLFGFVLIVAYFARTGFGGWLKTDAAKKSIIPVFLILLLGAYSAKTYTRNFTWKDGLTLFTTDAKTSVNSAKCNVSAGELLIKEAIKEGTPEAKKNKYLKDALVYLNKGVRIHPAYTSAWILFGNAYLYLKQYSAARQSFDNALRLSPKNKDAANNMLVVAQSSTRDKLWQNAEYAYLRLMKTEVKLDYLFSLAVVKDELNNPDTAMLLINQVLKADSTYAKAYNRLGQIYGKRYNDLGKAIFYLNKSLEYDKEDPSVWENLGVAYGILGKFRESVEAFKKSIEFGPENPQVYVNLGNSYMNLKMVSEAQEMFAKAKEVEAAGELKKKELPY
ncbi:MAG: tetratricopeptide repeat protein [Bacteroidetes bacterium]|nr:tetratricopeptide repeat protein [Bacteroidota bacterium]MBU1720988.1 tetratricopeptide repeat protein [Bacteroidota bacterium]